MVRSTSRVKWSWREFRKASLRRGQRKDESRSGQGGGGQGFQVSGGLMLDKRGLDYMLLLSIVPMGKTIRGIRAKGVLSFFLSL